jgi:hypothetical protein
MSMMKRLLASHTPGLLVAFFMAFLATSAAAQPPSAS